MPPKKRKVSHFAQYGKVKLLGYFLRQPVTKVILLTLGWILGLEILAYWAGHIFPSIDPSSITQRYLLVDQWFQWDSIFYHGIASEGYRSLQDPNIYTHIYIRTFYFPAFPMLADAVHSVVKLVGIDLRQAMLLLNFAATTGATIFIYKLAAAIRRSSSFGLRTVLYFLVFPFSFFLIAPYTEAVFIFFASGALYFIYKRQYALAAMMGIGATGTRLLGIVIPITMVLAHFEQVGWKVSKVQLRVLLLAVLSLAGLAGFLIYQQLAFHDWSYGLVATNEFWARQLMPNVFGTFADAFSNPKGFSGFDYRYDLINQVVSAIAFLGLTVVVFRKISVAFGTYCLLLILIPLTTGGLASMDRYVLPLIPCFIVLGMLGRHRSFHYAYIYLSVLFLALFTIMFTHGKWVG